MKVSSKEKLVRRSIGLTKSMDRQLGKRASSMKLHRADLIRLAIQGYLYNRFRCDFTFKKQRCVLGLGHQGINHMMGKIGDLGPKES